MTTRLSSLRANWDKVQHALAVVRESSQQPGPGPGAQPELASWCHDVVDRLEEATNTHIMISLHKNCPQKKRQRVGEWSGECGETFLFCFLIKRS